MGPHSARDETGEAMALGGGGRHAHDYEPLSFITGRLLLTGHSRLSRRRALMSPRVLLSSCHQMRGIYAEVTSFPSIDHVGGSFLTAPPPGHPPLR